MADVTNAVSLNPEDYPEDTTVSFRITNPEVTLKAKIISASYHEKLGCLRIKIRPDNSPYGDYENISYYEASGECIFRFKPEGGKPKGLELLGTLTVVT
ncbi:hypothetical protein JXR01_00260 [Candidatus Kaiserbacteria bacterium]|nr:MAG: hypothetical protein JXR01_00260 [Candidatus Kaiserbacteria bacterium]